MANGLYDGTLESIPGLGGYLQQQRLTQQQDLGTLQKAQAVGGIVQGQQTLADSQKVRAILTAGGDPATVVQSLIQAGPTGIDAAQKYMGVQQLQNSMTALKGLNLSDPNALRQVGTAMTLQGRAAEGQALLGLADHTDARQANVAGLANDQSQTAPVTTTPVFGLGAPGTPDAGVAANRANLPIADPGTGPIPPQVAAAIAQLKPGQPFAIQTAGPQGNLPPTDPTQRVGGAYSTLEQSADPIIAADAQQRQNRINAIAPANADVYSPKDTGANVSQLQTQEGTRQLQTALAGTKNEITIRGQDLGLEGRMAMVNSRMTMHGLNQDGTLNADGEATAQLVAQGKLPLAGQLPAIANRAAEVNPGVSQGQYVAGNATEKAMPALTQPFNAATLHLAQLGELAAAMNNNPQQLPNAILNKIAQWNGGDAPTNFDALKQIVGQEVTKAIVANGGSAGERDEASKTIAGYSSPAQFTGVINTYQNAMGAQLQALAQRYKAGGGQKDFSSFLLPEAQTAFQRESSAAPAAPGGALPANSVQLPNGQVKVFPSAAAAQGFRAAAGL